MLIWDFRLRGTAAVEARRFAMEQDAFERLQNARFYRFFESLYRMVLVNLCMLLLSLCGLVVFGLFPAIFAAAAYFNDVFEGKEGKVLKSMFGYFKQYFWSGNLMMLIYVPAVALGLYAVYGRELNTAVYLVLFFWLIAAIVLLWYFPAVNVLYPEFGLKKKILFSLVMSCGKWVMTLVFLAVNIAWIYIVLLIPQLMMFILFSAPVWFCVLRIKKAMKPDSFYDPLKEQEESG